jgi:HD-like signal output (HDOD) protein
VYFPEEYRTVLEQANSNKTFLGKEENQMLGIDHAALTGILMKKWNFPDSLVFPSRYHHEPAGCPLEYRHHAMIVGLADFLCHRVGIGNGGNPAPKIKKTLLDELKFSEKDLKELLQLLKEKRASIQEFFHLMK